MFQLSLADITFTMLTFAILIPLGQLLCGLRLQIARRMLRNLIVKSLETPNASSPAFFVGIPTAASLIKSGQCYQAVKLMLKLHKEVHCYGKQP